MQNYISISKSEAIAKFGHHFILESSDNRFGYVITEQLGHYYSIFDDEESMDFNDACGTLMAKVIVNSHKKIIENKMIMNTLSSKWDLYRYRKGWLKPETTQNIYNFLVKNDLARSNLEMVENHANCQIDFNLFTKPLPEQFHLPKTCFEKDKVYYQFKHSNSVNRNSEVVEVTPSSIELSYDQDNVISMSVSFKNLDGEAVNGSVSIRDFKQYSKAETGQQYFETGYSDTFIFMDKEACKQFAIDTINKDIEHFQKSIVLLS